jgi:hypothetical protein
MITGSNDDRSRVPEGAQPQRGLSYTSPLVSTTVYEVEGSPAPGCPAPQRTPISDEEMDSLMLLLRNVRTRLLWLYCEWAEEARKGRLSAAELEAKAAGTFEKLREQFVAHLVATLDACPAPIVVQPPPHDSPPGAE